MCFHPRWMYIAKTIAHQQIHSALVNYTCMQQHQCFSKLAKPITIIQRDNIFPCQLVVLGVIYVFIDLLILLSLNTCSNSPMNFIDRCKIEQIQLCKSILYIHIILHDCITYLVGVVDDTCHL